MKLLTELLTDIMTEAFVQCGYDRKYGQVVISDRLDLCQFQCNGALSGAKQYKKSPMLIASDAAGKIKENEMIHKVEVAPPGFINITLKDEYLLNFVESINHDPFMGIPQAEQAETILLDYGNPNVAKPLHVGHLRSAIIGEALKRIIRATGRTAIGDVHLGDWGLPMGLVLAELEDRYGKNIPPLTSQLLNEIYPFASAKSKRDEAFLKRARSITARLQKGDPAYAATWRRMVDISVEDIKRTFDRLGVSFDYWYGESNSSAYLPALLEILNEKQLLTDSEGAKVVEVAEATDKAPVPPTIVVKSNGSEGYATTDIATIYQRQKNFTPGEIWYVVDFRQHLHFTQVFRTARKAELIPETTKLEHLCFGTVNGKDGKPFKTRDGGVMQLSDLLDTVTACALERMKGVDMMDEVTKYESAEKIAIAAIKFGDLINHYSKDCIFDIDKFMASEGKTGVYLFYTVARINSILRKVDEADLNSCSLQGIYSDTERELLLKLALCGNAFIGAYEEKSPNILCENAYQLAAAFSKFYHETHILHEPDGMKRESYLALCVITKEQLLKHLNTLGIEPVEVM
ncbi:MAG: arginine--tRNA ligase [Clostridia bacterium]|nr:arginine--tRNA ligase [Clostridia bacterium]